MCSLHYGFVWISEPMIGTIRSIMSENCAISALTGFCTVSILIKNIKIRMILLEEENKFI